jgi:serine protease Do
MELIRRSGLTAAVLALVSSLATSAAAEAPKTRVAPAGIPITVAGQEGLQSILVKRIQNRFNGSPAGSVATAIFCSGAKPAVFTENTGKLVLQNFFATVRKEIEAAGYVLPKATVFADSANPTSAEYELGAALVELELGLCGSTTNNTFDGNIWVRFQWELYSPRERRVVYSKETEGSATFTDRKAFPEIASAAVASAVRNLLAQTDFSQQLLRRAQSQATQVSPSIALARRSTGTQAIGDNMPLLQSAVATLFSGNSSGSGFYINKEGWLLTNHHVVGDAKFVKVKLANGRELVGEVMRSSAKRDVALIKTEPVSLAPFEIAITTAQAGEDVYVLGSPLGEQLAYTVTRGVISATREVDGLRWLQSDVRILPGSSGGPMVGRTGAVLGLTSRGLASGSAGVNLFVPIAEALAELKIDYQLD